MGGAQQGGRCTQSRPEAAGLGLGAEERLALGRGPQKTSMAWRAARGGGVARGRQRVIFGFLLGQPASPTPQARGPGDSTGPGACENPV